MSFIKELDESGFVDDLIQEHVGGTALVRFRLFSYTILRRSSTGAHEKSSKRPTKCEFVVNLKAAKRSACDRPTCWPRANKVIK